ncbi:MAG: hypothetical protein IJ222_05380 [Bacteroidales bacterium]|nr:hypothetical protein [Bacteroidales bacterium]
MNQDMSNITSVLRKPRKCPHCGGKVVSILYGEPTPEAFEAAERGEFILGGCCINELSPHWECLSCGHQFIRVITQSQ